ncbi:MAG: cell division protein FtsZ, partial [Gammaproteobacteria bacterium]|nr:cell division protein FtsZ [Gammaproteobacteria bacterium]
MFEFMDSVTQDAVITVVGVGSSGGNVVQHMISSGVDSVNFICINTDRNALEKISGAKTLQIGCEATKGLDVDAIEEISQQTTPKDSKLIQEAIANTDMLFIVAGMGGGTGTGVAPVIAELARDMDILVVGVVTKPFTFEGPERMKNAMNGIEELRQNVDSLIAVSNDKLLDVYGRDFDLMHAFNSANDVLCNAVRGIAELITSPGVINVDFSDVRRVLSKMSMCMLGSGKAFGDDRAQAAAQAAVASPLLEDVKLLAASGILVNVTGANMTLGEFQDIGAVVSSFASDDATVVMGTSIDDSLGEELRVTIVVTGFDVEPFGKNHNKEKKHSQLETPELQQRNANDV